MNPTLFESQAAWRAWLQKNHARETELLLKLVRKGSAEKGLSYEPAVDEALCFGWIDGVRRSIDDDFWSIRFTPRKPKSIWSAVNLRKIDALIKAGRVAPPGMKVFETRDLARQRVYSFENPPAAFAPELEKKFRANEKAWTFFEASPKGYATTLRFWVMSAKKEETRLKRLQALIDACASGTALGQFNRQRNGG